MPEYSFTVIEYDPDRRWIVLATTPGKRSVESIAAFWDWAHREYPTGRYKVELDPWQEGERLKR